MFVSRFTAIARRDCARWRTQILQRRYSRRFRMTTNS